MHNTVNTIIGALIAALIGFGSTSLALLQQEGVNSVGDVSSIAWIVALIGAAMSFLKDFQALWTREQISKVTDVPEKYPTPGE